VQSPLVGALLTATAFAEPHTPLTAEEVKESEHTAAEPPLLPAQLQLHGPLPATVEALPALQRLAVGAVLATTPFALPHAPLISSRAEQLAVVPPPEPAQLHDHGPLPVTVDPVPALQRLVVGALVRSAPFEEPHVPLTAVAGSASVA